VRKERKKEYERKRRCAGGRTLRGEKGEGVKPRGRLVRWVGEPSKEKSLFSASKRPGDLEKKRMVPSPETLTGDGKRREYPS